jgi:diguanylate cyclase
VSSERRLLSVTYLLPWLVLVVMLSVTFWQWDHERQYSKQALHSQFEFALRDTVSQIEQRESAYEQILRGVKGLFATTDLNDFNAIRHYVNTLQLDADFYGIQGIGVIEKVTAEQKSSHITEMQRLSIPTYALSPPGEREMYTPIIQNITEAGRYKDILGVDSWVDPVRRKAMERARDSGMPAITDKLQLAADKDRDTPPSFIMYLPIFTHDKPQTTVMQRRANLIGWVYASFHMSDFMASLYGKQTSGLALAIYDDITPSDAALMYHTGFVNSKVTANKNQTLNAKEYLVVAGHTWTLALSSQDEFEERFGRDNNVLIAVFGVCLSLSLALLVRFMVVGRARALKLASAMTLELRHMAQHDHLTGLPNRTLFSEQVQQKLLDAEHRRINIALIFVDLDQFKPVNDSYGHTVGDQLLQLVAARLSNAIRSSDTVARIGGDEFVILLCDIDDATMACELAEKIRQAITQPFIINAIELAISCSMGVAVYPRDGTNEAALINSADKAMYYAKEQGRNKVKQVIEISTAEPS